MWEYTIVTQTTLPKAVHVYGPQVYNKHPGGDVKDLVAVLNLLGEAGWEAISMHSHGIIPEVLLRRHKPGVASP